MFFQIRIQNEFSFFQKLITIRSVHIRFDVILCLDGFYKRKPRNARTFCWIGHDFDRITVNDRLIKRNNLSVCSRDNKMISQIGMDRISKINRSSSLHQAHNVTLWGKCKDSIIKNIDSHL